MDKKTKEVSEAMVTACIKLADIGFLAGVGGNLAVRLDEERMAVTPSASDYYQMKPEDICILQIKDLKQLSGEKEPTTESGLHASFFLKRPDLKVSLHTHQPIASAATLLGIDIPLQSELAKKRLGKSLRIVSYAPSGTSFLVNAFKKRVTQDTNGYLLRNHGLVAGANSLAEAIQNVQMAEEESKDYLRKRIASNTNRPAPEILEMSLTVLANH
ncbi:class II aldolase/adducin family protein [Leptospira sp. 96542]|nr:class II aldolase/adducin family protein [Leptospira sp. 96542]